MRRTTKAIAIAATTVGAALVFERSLAAPRHAGPHTDHFDGRKFFNRDPAVQRGGAFLKWMLTRQRGRWRKWNDDAAGPKPPHRVADLRVTFINHSTTLIQIDNVNILTDPIWSQRTSPVGFAGPRRHRPPGIRFEDLPPIDLVLVSHNHYDHLDIPTLLLLQRDHAPRIITPLGNGELMAKLGVGGAIELDWWQSESNITVVPARHFSARSMSDRDRNLWGGFVIRSESGNVYFAGDTGWGSHFAQIGKRFAPIRLALLPIGAYMPRWFMRPAHIDPDEACEAHHALGAQTSIAIHFGTFALGDDGEEEPVWDLKQAAARHNNPRIWILSHGEGRDIPRIERLAPGHTASSTT